MKKLRSFFILAVIFAPSTVFSSDDPLPEYRVSAIIKASKGDVASAIAEIDSFLISAEDRFQRSIAINAIADYCNVFGRACVGDYREELQKTYDVLEPKAQKDVIGYMLYLDAFQRVDTYSQAKALVARPFPSGTFNLSRDDLLLADFHLRDGNFRSSFDAANVAVAKLVTFDQDNPSFPATFIGVLSFLVKLGDLTRAEDFYNIENGRILERIDSVSLLYRYRQTESALLAQLGRHEEAKLVLAEAVKHFLKLKLPQKAAEVEIIRIVEQGFLQCISNAGAGDCAKWLRLFLTEVSDQENFIASARQRSLLAIGFRLNLEVRNQADPELLRRILQHQKTQYSENEKAYVLFSAAMALESGTKFDQSMVLVATQLLTYYRQKLHQLPYFFSGAEILDKHILEIALISVANLRDTDLGIGIMSLLSRSAKDVDGNLVVGTQVAGANIKEHDDLRLLSRMRDRERHLLDKLLDRQPSNYEGLVEDRTWFWSVLDILGGQKTDSETQDKIWPNLNNIQRALDTNEVVIGSFQTSYNSRITACITDTTSMLVERKSALDKVQRLKFDVLTLTNSLRATYPADGMLDSQFPVESSRRLFEQLMKPIESCWKEKEKIIWLSEFEVPLEVLLAETPERHPVFDDGFELGEAGWLGAKYSILYFGSAREFITQRLFAASSKSSNGTFLGVGNPRLDGQTTEVLAMRGGLLRGAINTGAVLELNELPNTELELLDISTNENLKSARLLLGADASEQKLREELLSTFDVISFATHGLIRNEIEELKSAALVLTPLSSHDEMNDGLLTTIEIADLTINASLVILSACNTSNYQRDLFQGEVNSLVSAFRMAGAKAVLASNWYVDSVATRYLMTEFSDEYFERKDAGLAKKKAIQGMLKSGEYAHPRFWAGFQIFGDVPKREQAVSSISVVEVSSFSRPEQGKYFSISQGPAGEIYLFGGDSLNGGRGFVKELDEDLKVDWEFEDRRFLVTALAELDSEKYFAVMSGKLDQIRPLLFGLDKDDQPTFGFQLGEGLDSGFIPSLSIDENSELIEALMISRQEEQVYATVYLLTRSGEEVKRKEFLLSDVPTDIKIQYNAIPSDVGKNEILVAFPSMYSRKGYRSDGGPLSCLESSTKVFRIDRANDSIRSETIEGFFLSDIVADGHRKWAIGTVWGNECRHFNNHMAVYELMRGKAAELRYVEKESPTFGMTLFKTGDGFIASSMVQRVVELTSKFRPPEESLISHFNASMQVKGSVRLSAGADLQFLKGVEIGKGRALLVGGVGSKTKVIKVTY